MDKSQIEHHEHYRKNDDSNSDVENRLGQLTYDRTDSDGGADRVTMKTWAVVAVRSLTRMCHWIVTDQTFAGACCIVRNFILAGPLLQHHPGPDCRFIWQLTCPGNMVDIRLQHQRNDCLHDLRRQQ